MINYIEGQDVTINRTINCVIICKHPKVPKQYILYNKCDYKVFVADEEELELHIKSVNDEN